MDFASATQASDIHLNIILGGFGLFLLGIKFLGDGLKDIAGTRVRDYIEKYTGSLWSSILVGTVITALMQSSTAATVISISMVRAGLMNLKQAIGISIGANLGTTVTTLIIGLNVEEMGFYFIFIGAIILLFTSRELYKNIGHIVFGFGITFVGLKLMGDQLMLLPALPQFESFIRITSENNWLALGAGTLATALINSSTAVVAIVQKLFGTGYMSMATASAFVFGSNIGTTLTAVLATIGGSVSTRRAGWFHVIYNVLGAFIMMLFINPYAQLVLWVNGLIGGSPEMAVGISHFIFNLISTFAVIPFVPKFISLLEFLIPGEDKINKREKIKPLDYDLIDRYPEGAMQLARKSLVQMSSLALESFETTQKYLNSKDNEDYDVVVQLEDMINDLDNKITKYLLEIAKSSNMNMIAKEYTRNIEISKHIERISDLNIDLIKFYKLVFENRDEFSEEGKHDLEEMYAIAIEVISDSFDVLRTDDTSQFDKLIDKVDRLEELEETFREDHFERMANGTVVAQVAASVYVDILDKLERISVHSFRVAQKVKDSVKEKDSQSAIGRIIPSANTNN